MLFMACVCLGVAAGAEDRKDRAIRRLEAVKPENVLIARMICALPRFSSASTASGAVFVAAFASISRPSFW